MRRQRLPAAQPAAREHGLALVVCLIMLMLMSLAAATAARNAGNSEAVAHTTRTQALAMQAAEAALLYCEKVVQGSIAGPLPMDAPASGASHAWTSLDNWDGAASAAQVTLVPFDDSASNDAKRYFKRQPECMTQYQSAGQPGTVVITARGFGPDVAQADASRSAPRGAEVWLQSLLTR